VASCFNADCLGKTFVLRPDIGEPVTYPAESSSIAKEKIHVLEATGGSPYLPGAETRAFLKEHAYAALMASLGAGKTTVLVDHIQELINEKGQGLKVLVISTRRQQTSAWMSIYGPLGFVDYSKHEGGLWDCPRVVTCLNSLLRVLEPANQDGFCRAPTYDLVVLDEINNISMTLGSTLMEDNASIFECLRGLMLTSERVIIMDGLPTPAINNLLNTMDILDRFHWLVFHSFRFERAILCNGTSYFLKCFLNLLDKGENAFFVSNSKTVITRFRDLAINKAGLAPDTVLAIHGGMDEATRLGCGNPDTWLRYRLVLANMSLGPGVSFNPTENPLHFSATFFIAKVSYGVLPEDVGQLIRRVRHLKDNVKYGLVLRKTENLSQKAVKADTLMQDREKTISSYAQSAIAALGPSRLVKKRLDFERDFLAQEAKRARQKKGAYKPRQMPVYQPTLVLVPKFDESRGELAGEPRPLAFGLTFAPTPVGRLCALNGALCSYWASDSENYLKRLTEILIKSGCSVSTVGPRKKIVHTEKGPIDEVLGSHYTFLNKVQAMADSRDSDHINNDYFLEQARSWVSTAQFNQIRETIYDSNTQDTSGTLMRFAAILRTYDGTHESILKAMDRDVATRFEIKVGLHGHIRIQDNSMSLRPGALPRRGDLNHVPTLAELIECFHNILLLMEHTFDPVTKSIQTTCKDGQWCTLAFYLADMDTRRLWFDTVQRLARLHIRANPSFEHRNSINVHTFLKQDGPDGTIRDHRLVFSVLYPCLKWLGFPVLVDDRRRMVDGTRTTVHIISFDQRYFALCKGLVGFSTAGQQVPISESMKDYFIYVEQHPPATPKKKKRAPSKQSGQENDTGFAASGHRTLPVLSGPV